MYTFESLHSLLEERISQLSFPWPPDSLYEPIRYTLSLGGKRIRPTLTLIGCNIFNKEVEQAILPAIGIEIFHNFTLLHDDLMDKADMRRNHLTVHKKWNDNVAILSGDAMMIAAYHYVCQAKTPFLPAILPLFTETALQICGGQQYDMEFEKRKDVTEAEYMEMIRLKTAVLLACSLKMGAILGGADEKDADQLYSFGIHIGLAFQLMDDLLDVYGDPKVFGKAIGGDIACNKKTFLLINALDRADDSERNILLENMENPTVDKEKKVQIFTSIYNQLHLEELTKTEIEAHYKSAFECLEKMTVEKEQLTPLIALTEKLMYRQS